MSRRIAGARDRQALTATTLYAKPGADGPRPADVRTNVYAHREFADDLDPG
ncbi:unnamed protein product, partial [Heterosigma akashiwo]